MQIWMTSIVLIARPQGLNLHKHWYHSLEDKLTPASVRGLSMYDVNFTVNVCVTLLQILIKMPAKRAQWTKDNLRAALVAIERGQLTQRAAAERHHIPRRTRRVSVSESSS
ncbi:hypothetical protein ACJJTC_001923 [Scirpophaga incertulas]